MKVRVILVKGLIKRLKDLEMRGPEGTFQITASRSARILSRVQETRCPSSEKPSANARVKKSQKWEVNNSMGVLND